MRSIERGLKDRHQFRIILSPEDGVTYDDLKPFTRDVMAQVEKDLGMTIDWVAVANRLEGLRARLMAPEIAAEAMRAYAEETDRLNRERRAGSETDRKALADVEKKLKEIVTAIEDGGYSRPLMMRLGGEAG